MSSNPRGPTKKRSREAYPLAKLYLRLLIGEVEIRVDTFTVVRKVRIEVRITEIEKRDLLVITIVLKILEVGQVKSKGVEI